MVTPLFDYYEAFSRNIGFLEPDELFQLRTKKVAIAGLGGVGGSHLLTLTRLGIGNFHLAEFDFFELGNFNRQAGATFSSLGQPKIDVMARQAQDINPELKVTLFREGVQPENMDSFLEGIDLFVDGLDINVFPIRRLVFMECHRRNIPVITVAPVGMGFSMVNFIPGKMNFDQYFHTKESMDPIKKMLTFVLGVLPSNIHLSSVVYPRAFDFDNQRTASTPMGVMFATAAMGTEALKILLKRGPVIAAPRSIHYDGYSYRIKRSCLYGGTRNPLLLMRKFMVFLLGYLR